MWNRIEKADELNRANEPFVMATVVRTQGSTPRKQGARMLVAADLVRSLHNQHSQSAQPRPPLAGESG